MAQSLGPIAEETTASILFHTDRPNPDSVAMQRRLNQYTIHYDENITPVTVKLLSLRECLPAVSDRVDISWGMGIKVVPYNGEKLIREPPNERDIEKHLNGVSETLKKYFGPWFIARDPDCIEFEINKQKTLGPWPTKTFMTKTELPTLCKITDDVPNNIASIEPCTTQAEEMIKTFYGEEQFRFLNQRHQRWELIEVIHPSNRPSTTNPCILCDATTVTKDAKTTEQITRWRTVALRNKWLKHDDCQRWVYLPNHTCGELLVRRVASKHFNWGPEEQVIVPAVRAARIASGQSVIMVRMTFVLWLG